MRLVFRPAYLFLLFLGAFPALSQSSAEPRLSRDERHATDAWRIVAEHLPDPSTTTASALETEGDILRARRFPEDAIDYYNHALDRGGPPARLLNKIGLTELELRNVTLAHAYFARAVKVGRRDANAWNNLGAADYIDGDPVGAISAYKKAIKLDHREAVYHANLATIYFERKDFSSARKQIAMALKLDPAVFDRNDGQGGIAAHVLSAEDHARLSFEMARMYAKAHLEDSMVHSLAMAAESGMDIVREMKGDPVLARYVTDPRVVLAVQNAQALRVAARRTSPAPVAPALAESKAPVSGQQTVSPQ